MAARRTVEGLAQICHIVDYSWGLTPRVIGRRPRTPQNVRASGAGVPQSQIVKASFILQNDVWIIRRSFATSSITAGV
jgi:hypothetical protein